MSFYAVGVPGGPTRMFCTSEDGARRSLQADEVVIPTLEATPGTISFDGARIIVPEQEGEG